MKLLTILLFLLPGMAWSLPIKLDQGKTQFLAVGNPGFLKIKGKGRAPQGTLTIDNGKLNGKLSVDLKSFDTGMNLRNQHMKEKYLQVDQFPTAEIEFLNAAIKKDWSLEKPEVSEMKIPARLSIHGQSRPIEVSALIKNDARLVSKFEINIADFKIDIPSFMGVTVANKVKVEVESKLISAKN